jgi:hypothetical protein
MSKLVDFAIIMIALAFSALWYLVYFAVFGPDVILRHLISPDSIRYHLLPHVKIYSNAD